MTALTGSVCNAGYIPYYSNAAFNKCMPLSVVYTATAHLVTLLLKPFNRLRVETLQKEDRFHPTTVFGDSGQKNRHVAIVTGSNTGIGFETASSLVEMGYDVILACRSRNKGEEAAEKINNSFTTKDDGGGKALFLHPLDLSSLTSVTQFVDVFSQKYDSLNILINNAGINTTGQSQDEMDLCFQTNYLGHFLLTKLLTPSLLNAKNYYYDTDSSDWEAGRVVNLSSVTHHFVRPDETRNVDGKQEQLTEMNQDWWKGCATPGASDNTYKESKLAAVLFTQELNKRYSKNRLRAVTANPGAVNSDIWRAYPKFLLKYVLGPLFRLLYLTPKEGSQTSLVAAVGNLPPDAAYIQPYWLPTKKIKNKSKSFPFTYALPFPVFEMLGLFIGHAVTEPRLPENTEYHSKTLWDVSEKLVGVENK